MTTDFPASSASRTHPPSYRRYWVALLRRDVALAEQFFLQAREAMSPARLYLKFFAPALQLSGDEWARGRIDHQAEHFITHHTLRFMRLIRRELVVPRPTGPVALAASVAQERHRVGLRMVCDFLQSQNWQIQWLRAGEPEGLSEVLARWRPRAILLSIGMAEGLGPAERILSEARREGFEGLAIVGGRAIDADPSLVKAIGADLTAMHGLQLLRTLRRGHSLHLPA
jgi:methanogenic corrinoid protein MtbC1